MNWRSNKLSRFKIMFIGSFLVTGLLYSCHSEENAPEEKTEAKQAVAELPVTEVFPVNKGRLSSSLQIPGELIAYQQVDLYAKEASFVKKLYVDVGSEVTTGQLLVSMEAPELGSQLAGALSNIKSQEAIYLASKANYDRLYETSQTPGTISPNDLEQAAARKNSDFAQLQAAKAAYRQIAETQNYLQIRAPFSGVISARNVNLGAYVGPSGKGSEVPLFTLQEQKRLRLVISVPEAYTSYLNQKNEVSFTVKALPDQHFKAHIKRLAGAIDNRLHAQRIEMDVVNNDIKLLPGMVAEVNLPLPSNDSTFIVPKSAVVNSTESVFVIRVVNNKAERVNVKTGREANGTIEIYGNLNPGDLLIKTATDEIRNSSDLQNVKAVTL
ncbi:efflux RND transporter periplasmic adaptor subunit [Chitinophagaceae bacterium LB-8]|uniref:Efflux RND transporter periplasmic adaptor subunit n=1 Tax=Paraflavisolibacter caeni TaxID=2982496 RepID=A0A9X3B8F1_9BACT|nr:efflux RND transporter periplasmic adaptor subunit [Paraflavisolibacter caeni]MCU7549696.1 efflux RND transporter periplasmic adaptor subunit [Paraflavisolibacter caeni]